MKHDGDRYSGFGRSLSELCRELLPARGSGCASHHRGGSASHHACGCDCAIVETECPPRCVGVVGWKIGRGAVPEASIAVRNAGAVARLFEFAATELAGLAPGDAHLAVSPASAQLEPGAITVVRVSLAQSESLSACQVYRGELRIRGAFEQCVAICCEVGPDAFDNAQLEQSDSLVHKSLHASPLGTRIDWKILRGMVPEAAVALHNTGKTAHAFSVEPSALVGASGLGAQLTRTPDSLQLAPGETGVVRVSLTGSLALHPGQIYCAELRVRGFYDQRLPVRVRVEPDASGYLELEHGDPPVRRRAHRWYDHFQCTEPCGPELPGR